MKELLQNVCGSLENQNIEYMLSGSLVSNIYALPSMAMNIDLVVNMQNEDIEAFVKHFEKDFYCHAPSIETEIARKGMFNLIDYKTGFKIDFIVRKDSPYRRTEFARRGKANILGADVWVVSIEDLILSKLIWIQELQSDKQIEDIKSLLENAKTDWGYIKQWADELKLNTYGIF